MARSTIGSRRRRYARRANVVALGALFALGCGGATEPRPGHVILFIGNSLFDSYDLPGTVAAIAAQDSYPLTIQRDVQGSTALIDHLKFQVGPNAIRRGRWDYVVMQQGPSMHQVCYDTLVLAVQGLDKLVRASGGRSAVFMSWPAAADSANGGFDRVRESFQNAAKAVDGLFIPAGEAWRIAWRSDSTLPLYQDDGYHPAELGTYLAALVVYERISGRDARRLPPVATLALGDLPVPRETVILLQQAAHAANVRYGAGTVKGLPPIPTPTPIIC